MAITFVQDETDSAADTTQLVTNTGVQPGAGHLCVITITGNNQHATGITGGGVTWALAKQSAKTSYIADIWYGMNASGSGGSTYTIDFAGATSCGVNFAEFAGVLTADALDTGNNTNAGTSVTPTPGSMTAVSPGPVLYVAVMARATATAVSSGPTDSFAPSEVAAGGGVIPNVGCYRIDAGTPAAANPSWTLAGSVAWEMTIAAFRAEVPAVAADPGWTLGLGYP